MKKRERGEEAVKTDFSEEDCGSEVINYCTIHGKLDRGCGVRYVDVKDKCAVQILLDAHGLSEEALNSCHIRLCPAHIIPGVEAMVRMRHPHMYLLRESCGPALTDHCSSKKRRQTSLTSAVGLQVLVEIYDLVVEERASAEQEALRLQAIAADTEQSFLDSAVERRSSLRSASVASSPDELSFTQRLREEDLTSEIERLRKRVVHLDRKLETMELDASLLRSELKQAHDKFDSLRTVQLQLSMELNNRDC